MLKFLELQLGNGWDAEPNAPDPQVSVAGSTVNVRFRLLRLRPGIIEKPSRVGVIRRFLKANPVLEPENGCGTLSFLACSRWRWDATNDHEWYKHDGHGRYSRIAPEWGKFYELVGEDTIRDAVPWEAIEADSAAARHFLFYFRDETLEFMAEEWSFAPD